MWWYMNQGYSWLASTWQLTQKLLSQSPHYEVATVSEKSCPQKLSKYFRDLTTNLSLSQILQDMFLFWKGIHLAPLGFSSLGGLATENEHNVATWGRPEKYRYWILSSCKDARWIFKEKAFQNLLFQDNSNREETWGFLGFWKFVRLFWPVLSRKLVPVTLYSLINHKL